MRFNLELTHPDTRIWKSIYVNLDEVDSLDELYEMADDVVALFDSTPWPEGKEVRDHTLVRDDDEESGELISKNGYTTYIKDDVLEAMFEVKRQYHYLDDVGAMIASLACIVGSNFLSTFEDAFVSESGTPAEAAEEIVGDCYGEVPNHLMKYVDWDKMGEDMFQEGDYGGIFRSEF